MTDGAGDWDKPVAGGNYEIVAPGRYALRHGVVESASSSRRVLLVTDLDDTLVGDDNGLAAFGAWWAEHAVPAGCRLVYNTGRPLELFLGLLAEKGHLLPEPDLLISAVGTRIYAKHAGTGTWREDEGYRAQLEPGWELQAVRDAAYSEVARVGREAVHFRPPAEQNEHKVTCGVHADVADDVRLSLERRLRRRHVAVRIVMSGAGDWRFLDLIPAAAGKHKAMEYAAKVLGFHHEDIVAAGDSGNDVDMLEGAAAAIVVSNAQPDLVAWADQESRETVVRTSKPRAWGIMDGLQQLGCV